MTVCKLCLAGLCVCASSCQKVVYQADAAVSLSYICRKIPSPESSCCALFILFLFLFLFPPPPPYLALHHTPIFLLSASHWSLYPQELLSVKLSSTFRWNRLLFEHVPICVRISAVSQESCPSRRWSGSVPAPFHDSVICRPSVTCDLWVVWVRVSLQ